MNRTEDDDTEPLRPPASKSVVRRRPKRGGPRRPTGGPASEGSEPWLRDRTYRFGGVEAALLAVTCVVALSMATDVWPVVQLDRRRLRLRWPAAVEPSPHQRKVWAELEGWMRELGGREVSTEELDDSGASAGG